MRSTALTVDTQNAAPDTKPYDLTSSPRSSMYSDLKGVPATPSTTTMTIPTTTQHDSKPLTPSLRLLFSFLSPKYRLLLLLPAIVSSLVAGGIAPFMTFVVGQVFAAFAVFSTSFTAPETPSQDAKDQLMHSVGIAALELVALGVGALALGSLTSCLWIWTGERNVLEVRRKVYRGVMGRSVRWFDGEMGGEAEGHGAGGLMAKFTRETDDVRSASSLAPGLLIQHLTTTITCLVLAFTRSWALTLVILSAVPLLVVIQGLSQGLAAPLLAAERDLTTRAASRIDATATAIPTVKAFNAQALEVAHTSTIFESLNATGRRLAGVWGLTAGASQFVAFTMFVQGFWFGAKLVREGKGDAGDVMAVFWACLIATTNLQMCIPQLIVLAKGKDAACALLELASSAQDDEDLGEAEDEQDDKKKHNHNGTLRLRKIRPAHCMGEFSLHNVSFSYPSSTAPALSDVSLFLPASELTFLVGASGSGKSTAGALLLGLYPPTQGQVCLDERDVRYLERRWMRGEIMGLGQGWGADVVVPGLSIAENVELAVTGLESRTTMWRPTRGEVEEACRAAMLHEFVLGLPDGYETVLSAEDAEEGGGILLSGGQRQRLAIARARLRNPRVLVLDEATSALDPTTRLLVFAALRTWRKGRTTIVITHDLSQIEATDFIYVMKSGRVAEQGYRTDLEAVVPLSPNPFESTKAPSYHSHDNDEYDGRGEFRKMLDVQLGLGGCLPEVASLHDSPAPEYESDFEDDESVHHRPQAMSMLRPLTMGNWMFDAIAELAAPAKHQQLDHEPLPVAKKRPVSIHVDVVVSVPPAAMSARSWDRRSLQFTPTSPVFPTHPTSMAYGGYGYGWGRSRADLDDAMEDVEFEQQKTAVARSGTAVLDRREKRGERLRWANLEDKKEVVETTNKHKKWALSRSSRRQQQPQQQEHHELPPPALGPPGFWSTLRLAWPHIPHKPLVILGLLLSAFSGLMTPLFSFLLSRLLYEVSSGGASNTRLINTYGGLVLGVAALDGILMGLKYFVMEGTALAWVTRLRSKALTRVLGQDKAWFDSGRGRPEALVQVLVKDAEDARNLVAVVAGQAVVVAVMLGVGLLWAMARGWELTLVGLGVAPVFAGVMAAQTVLVAECEGRNKLAREEVGRAFYAGVKNVRAARAMGLGGVWRDRFEGLAWKAKETGVRGALVEGCTYGVASGLVYAAEGLLFWVGAVLVVKGRYNYLQMVQVLNLVVFTVTIGSQLMAFTQKIAKSVQATHDLHSFLHISARPSDATGTLKPTIAPADASIDFSNVSFCYPSQPALPVLRNLSLSINPGESVAIVGASGSGKSTMAALLQRLYEPTQGTISLSGIPLPSIDAAHLREAVGVVSQHPHLFDASVAENIRYGSSNEAVSDVDIRRAAKTARAHEFVMGLKEGYDTSIGAEAVFLSGGQAQRLQIARALARRSGVLVLDECTSALDGENQRAVVEGVLSEKGRTVVMVTHKEEVMRMCDRIVVLADGEVKEDGSYEELIRRKGLFTQLASGGEWDA